MQQNVRSSSGRQHHTRAWIACLATVLACASFARGQTQFSELTRTVFPIDEGLFRRMVPSRSTPAVAAADVDRDGDLDLALGVRLGYWSAIKLYINTGRGEFRDESAGRLPAHQGTPYEVVFGDVDGDGDPDILVCQGEAPSKLYLNDGSGRFADRSSWLPPPRPARWSRLALGDLDGDGDLDTIYLFEPIEGGWELLLWLNDGTGRYSEAIGSHLPRPAAPTNELALGDVDADGDLDLFLQLDGKPLLYLNDGQGFFTDATARLLPTTATTPVSLALGDVDGDRDLDLLLAGWSTTQLFRNDGKGKFTDATSSSLPAIQSDTVVPTDIDADGDLDLLLARGSASIRRKSLLLNDGNGKFVLVASGLPDGASTGTIVPADVDGDGDVDFVLGNYGSTNKLYLNAGDGSFSDANKVRTPIAVGFSNPAFGDVDGDGDLDLLVNNYYGGTRCLYLNDGDAFFTDPDTARIRASGQHPNAVYAADFDGDGDLDMLQSRDGPGLFFNDGRGFFIDVSSTHLPPHGSRGLLAHQCVAIGDVDADGDPDLVFGNHMVQNGLLLNNGKGFFTDVTSSRMPLFTQDTWDVALGDVDGDGDLDIAEANVPRITGPGQDRLLVNDGRGTFTESTGMPREEDSSYDVALGDIDGDGDLDMVIAVGNLASKLNIKVNINDGKGAFRNETAARIPSMSVPSYTVALGDMDLDGDLDLVIGEAEMTTNIPRLRFYLNDGAGRFSDATTRRMAIDPVTAARIALGDADGDGDLDIAVAELPSPVYAGRVRLLLNLHRHVASPQPAQVGLPYTLTFLATPGYGGVNQAVWPFLGTRALQPRLRIAPFGDLGVDPTSMLSLPGQLIPPPGGSVSLTFLIPSIGALRGLTLYTQALFFHSGEITGARLSNVCRDRIL